MTDPVPRPTRGPRRDIEQDHSSLYRKETGRKPTEKAQPDPLPSPSPRKGPGSPSHTFWKHIRLAVIVLALMGLALYGALQYSKSSWQKKVQQSKRARPVVRPIASRSPDAKTGIIQEKTLSPRIAAGQGADTDAIRSAVFLAERGQEMEEAADLSGAIASYREAVETWPHLTDAWAGLGRVYLQTRQFAEARKTMERAVELEPERVEYLNDLGAAHLMQNRVEDAYRLFTQALILDKNYDRTYYNLALCYIALQDRIGARRFLEKYLELHPDNANALRQVAYLAAALGDYEAALKRLREAMVERPDWALLYLDAAAAQALLGLDEDTLASLRRAEELGSALEVQRHFQQPAFKELRESDAGQEYSEGLNARAVTQQNPATKTDSDLPSDEPLLSSEP